MVVIRREIGWANRWSLLLLEEYGHHLGGDRSLICRGIKPRLERLIVGSIGVGLVVRGAIRVLISRSPGVGTVVVGLSLVPCLIGIILIIDEAEGNLGEVASREEDRECNQSETPKHELDDSGSVCSNGSRVGDSLVILAHTVNLLVLDLLGDGLEGPDSLHAPLDTDEGGSNLEDSHEEEAASWQVDTMHVSMTVGEWNLRQILKVKCEEGIGENCDGAQTCKDVSSVHLALGPLASLLLGLV